MKKDKTRRPILVLVAALTWLALAGTVTPVRSQDLVCCDIFIDADGRWFGARRDCKKAMEELSPASRSSACEQLRKSSGPWFTPFASSASRSKCCPEVAELCGHVSPTCKAAPDSAPPKKCEKPTPWFGTSSNCSEVQSPVIAINAGAVTLTMCGYPVFRWVPPDPKDELYVGAYKAALRDHVQARVGSKICCDKLREAARTGTPCYPGYDVDCDGKPNQSDIYSENPDTTFPDINNLFSKPEGAAIDPFPPGLDPDDPNFLPPPDKCDCKWELVKGTLNCSRDGKQPHFYQARWRCPSTGNERFTRKEAPATAPCP